MINPGEGYRLLTKDDPIILGVTEVLAYGTGPWEKITYMEPNARYLGNSYPMREPLKAPEDWTYWLMDLPPLGVKRPDACGYCHRPRAEHREDLRCPIPNCTLQGPPSNSEIPLDGANDATVGTKKGPELSFSVDAGRVKIQWPRGLDESRFPGILRDVANFLEAPSAIATDLDAPALSGEASEPSKAPGLVKPRECWVVRLKDQGPKTDPWAHAHGSPIEPGKTYDVIHMREILPSGVQGARRLDLDALKAFMREAMAEKPDLPGMEIAAEAWIKEIEGVQGESPKAYDGALMDIPWIIRSLEKLAEPLSLNETGIVRMECLRQFINSLKSKFRSQGESKPPEARYHEKMDGFNNATLDKMRFVLATHAKYESIDHVRPGSTAAVSAWQDFIDECVKLKTAIGAQVETQDSRPRVSAEDGK